MPATAALVLFAHGSRDPEWVRPFESLRATVARQAPALTVALAYLESAQPPLEDCLRTLAAQGIRDVRVLPLFLAMGRHLRHDLPALAAAVIAAHPELCIEFLPALGEAPEFIAAVGAIAMRAAGNGDGPPAAG